MRPAGRRPCTQRQSTAGRERAVSGFMSRPERGGEGRGGTAQPHVRMYVQTAGIVRRLKNNVVTGQGLLVLLTIGEIDVWFRDSMDGNAIEQKKTKRISSALENTFSLYQPPAILLTTCKRGKIRASRELSATAYTQRKQTQTNDSIIKEHHTTLFRPSDVPIDVVWNECSKLITEPSA